MLIPVRIRRRAGITYRCFVRGWGAVSNPPAAGAAAPNSPLSRTVATVGATIGGVNAPVIFAGLAPGFIGLYQVNVTVPLGAPVGGAVPLILLVGSAVFQCGDYCGAVEVLMAADEHGSTQIRKKKHYLGRPVRTIRSSKPALRAMRRAQASSLNLKIWSWVQTKPSFWGSKGFSVLFSLVHQGGGHAELLGFPGRCGWPGSSGMRACL